MLFGMTGRGGVSRFRMSGIRRSVNRLAPCRRLMTFCAERKSRRDGQHQTQHDESNQLHHKKSRAKGHNSRLFFGRIAAKVAAS